MLEQLVKARQGIGPSMARSNGLIDFSNSPDPQISRATKSEPQVNGHLGDPLDTDDRELDTPCYGRLDDRTADAEPAPLRRIGRFQIERELGRGGLGVVFLAYDPVLNRRVALKVPRPEVLVTPEVRVRFEREAHAAARLAHPHLVPVYEVGQAGAILYMISAYCAGPNLTCWLKHRGRPLAPRQAAQLIVELADAVQYAHSQGVLHRDIKPSNVLMDPLASGALSGDDALDRELSAVPKLVDFGLARLEGTVQPEKRTGVAMGTPGYMAPEQAEGRTREIGPATDVHGLGAVLYELLTGRGPFAGTSEVDMLHRVLSEEPMHPARINPRVSRDLEAICLKCLEKRPLARYATAADLADDLRRYLAGEATVARPLRPLTRACAMGKAQASHRGAAAVSVVAALIITGGSAFYSLRLGSALAKSEERRIEADEARTAAEANRQLAEKNRLEMAHEQDANNQYLYAARMKQAAEMLAQGNIEQLEQLLAQYDDSSPHEKLRGFEWHYLKRLLHSERLTLRGHAGEVYGVAFSPDGKTLVSSGEDGTIRVWEPTTGKQLHIFVAHESCTNDLDFSPDGKLLASASCDKTVKLWDTRTWGERAKLSDHHEKVLCVAFSPDGRELASGGQGGLTCIWDTETACLRAATRETNPWDPDADINAVCWSPNGKYLVVSGARPRVRDARTLEELKALRGLVTVSVSPDSRLLASRGDRNQIKLWKLPAGQARGELAGHRGIHKLAFGPTEKTLFSSGEDCTIRIWHLDSDMVHNDMVRSDTSAIAGRALLGHTARVQDLTVSPDGRMLASASFDGTVRLWDLAKTGGDVPAISFKIEAMKSPAFVALAPDFGTLSVLADDEQLDTWNVPQARLEKSLPVKRFRQTLWRALSPNGQTVIHFDSKEGGVRLTKTREPEAPPLELNQHVLAVNYSADGRYAIAKCGDGKVHIWDLASDREAWAAAVAEETRGSRIPEMQLATCALANKSNKLAVFNFHEGVVDLPAGHYDRRGFPGGVANAVFSPDDSLLAASRWDGTLCFVDPDSGAVLRKTQLQSPSNLAFSPDGRTLAAATDLGSVALCHVATGNMLMTLPTREGHVSDVRFSADGQSLAAVVIVTNEESGNGFLYVWSGQ